MCTVQAGEEGTEMSLAKKDMWNIFSFFRNSVSCKQVSDQGHCWAVVRVDKLRRNLNLINLILITTKIG